jgi:phenylpyruvate tautomerase PptA (4-oxalocrotonate tautomerase family)
MPVYNVTAPAESLSAQDKRRIAEEITRPVKQVPVIVRDVPAKYIFEGGRIMPEPGQEAAWLAAGEDED